MGSLGEKAEGCALTQLPTQPNPFLSHFPATVTAATSPTAPAYPPGAEGPIASPGLCAGWNQGAEPESVQSEG